MAVDSKNVFVGRADQKTAGAVRTAAVGTACPASAKATLDTATWTDSGWISEDGLAVSQDYSTTPIKEWNGGTVRTLPDTVDRTVQYTELETSYETMCRMVGTENVTKTNADAQHGTQLKVNFGTELPPARAWAFLMKDEDRRMIIFLPNAQITSVDTVNFVRNDAVKWTFTLTCNSDADGYSMYLLTDDGQVVTNG